MEEHSFPYTQWRKEGRERLVEYKKKDFSAFFSVAASHKSFTFKLVPQLKSLRVRLFNFLHRFATVLR